MNIDISLQKKSFKKTTKTVTGIGYICLILSIGYSFLGSIPKSLKSNDDDFSSSPSSSSSSYWVMGKDLGGGNVSEVGNDKPETSGENKINTSAQFSINQVGGDKADRAINIYGLETANKKSLQHLTFTGKIKGGGNVIVYLGLSTTIATSVSPQSNEGIVTTMRGFYIESGRFLTKPLLGEFKGVNLQSALESQKIELYELKKRSSQFVTNRVMTLSKGKRYWFASGPGIVMRFLPYKSKSVENFNYNHRLINPQSLLIILEEAQGYNLAVDLRTRNNRPFKTDGNWQMVNLEYGYVRYQILGQQGNVWILAVELDKADGNSPVRQIVKVVRVNNILGLVEIVDSDEVDHSKLHLENLQINGNTIVYHKNYSEKGTVGLLKSLRSYIKTHNLNSALLPMIEDSVKDELETTLCNSCTRITVQYQYDTVKEILIPNKVIFEPERTENASSDAGFQTFVKQAHDASPTVSTLGELETLLILWSSTYNNLP